MQMRSVIKIIKTFCRRHNIIIRQSFFFRDKGEELNKHEHVELILDDSISFRFHDVRKFGKMHLIDKSKVYDVEPLSEMGYEYNDEKLTKEYSS